MPQWFFRITAYAERLLDDLDGLDWPEGIKAMQRNWIGRSEGAEVDFPVEGTTRALRVFTTRPDTLWGATFMVLAPEHPLVAQITTDEQRAEVEAYVARAQRESEIDRLAEGKEKTGVFTGGYAINPVNGERIPIWVADYVRDGLRHRRDHGRARARPARLRVRPQVRPARSSRSISSPARTSPATR